MKSKIYLLAYHENRVLFSDWPCCSQHHAIVTAPRPPSEKRMRKVPGCFSSNFWWAFWRDINSNVLMKSKSERRKKRYFKCFNYFCIQINNLDERLFSYDTFNQSVVSEVPYSKHFFAYSTEKQSEFFKSETLICAV